MSISALYSYSALPMSRYTMGYWTGLISIFGTQQAIYDRGGGAQQVGVLTNL